ncbi:TrlF family AAA-like ATPase [Stenotrophomonas maltophilia]|uniref:TrlF family AAA-like ATPase n=1 Tax=Stenotrophomonas maltophilia TaxID=40324 RepID=UPI002557AB29|nr:AAA family ATPase [Stenotrophomonas maltophilia]
MGNDIKFAGSNWWSFDFHNHTPASSDYDPRERGGLTPRDWLLAYMRSGVDCVAVTDHNSGEWIDRLKQELEAMEAAEPRDSEFRSIHLFPGVELTSSEGIHVLALYGPQHGAAKVHGLLALAQYNGEANNAHGMCQQGASAICDHVHSTGGLVVLAHVEEKNGIFEVAGDGNNRFVPVRSVRSVEQLLEKADALEVHDLNSPASLHYLDSLKGRALVDGSDAHNTGRAGARYVWVKMAQPSIEGLKLALLDPTSSLLRFPRKPVAPLHRITSLRITQLQLRRQLLEIPFSPWFTAIIGGRGSGKSTILEALRLALARERDIRELGDAQESDVVRSFDRFRTVVGGRGKAGMIRQDTVLVAEIEKHDPSANTSERYAFTWTPNGFGAKRLDAGVWRDTGLSVEQAAKSFPVKVFSQKQIFELAERPRALLTYIDRAPEVDIQAWTQRNEELRRAFRTLRGRELELLQSVRKRAELETELLELSRKTLAYQQSNIAEQLRVYGENQQAQQAVDVYVEALLSPIRRLDAALEHENPYEGIRMVDVALQQPDPATLYEDAAAIALDLGVRYQAVRRLISEMRQQVERFQQLPSFMAHLRQTESAISSYREEVAALAAQGVGTAQEAEVAMRRSQELEASLALIAANEEQLDVLQKDLRVAYARLKLHRRKLTKLRRVFVASVLESNPNLRITIEEQADLDQSNEEFRAILRLQENTFVEDVLSLEEDDGSRTGLLGKLTDKSANDPSHRRVTSLKAGVLARRNSILGHPVRGRFLTALTRLGPDDHEALLEWFPHDLVKVEFRRSRNDSFQPLERASAGQKTSSVLSFLLSHGDEPLLLDQPEDDLDNALVSELVVDQIRSNKYRRQIIVVTHNPNIVVNGDAELVLPMAFNAGQIQQNDAGGLQERAVRERICDIMEGGRDAFRQRYKRIFEDLNAN